jgi:hypothetical protein
MIILFGMLVLFLNKALDRNYLKISLNFLINYKPNDLLLFFGHQALERYTGKIKIDCQARQTVWLISWN